MVRQHDPTTVEMLEALGAIGINRMESILNKMYDRGATPNSLSRPIFVTLSKNTGLTGCERH